jgi:hypothetical protein
MTVLVLIGPRATEPVELARRVAEGRALTAVFDVADVIGMLSGLQGADDDTKRMLGIDLATAMASRLAGLDVDVILAEAAAHGSTAAYRDGLMFVDSVTLVALTADPGRLALRDLGRGPDMLSGISAWRSWKAHLAQLGASKPTFVDYDVILDCADRSRADLVRLIRGTL